MTRGSLLWFAPHYFHLKEELFPAGSSTCFTKVECSVLIDYFTFFVFDEAKCSFLVINLPLTNSSAVTWIKVMNRKPLKSLKT